MQTGTRDGMISMEKSIENGAIRIEMLMETIGRFNHRYYYSVFAILEVLVIQK